jgi:hypothetical protein
MSKRKESVGWDKVAPTNVAPHGKPCRERSPTNAVELRSRNSSPEMENLTRELVPPYARRGASILEMLVSCTLLAAVLSVATPLILRHNRLLVAHREYQMALDELSNQLERLTAIPAAELPAALEKLAPSDLAAAHLHGARLTGELAQADQGQRLTLHLVWDEPQRKSAPVSLAAWIYRRADTAPQEAGP